MREFIATQPVPAFSETAFTEPPALKDARVAIVTTAALQREGAAPWIPDLEQIMADRARNDPGPDPPGTPHKTMFEDTHFRALPHEARDLKLGHISQSCRYETSRSA